MDKKMLLFRFLLTIPIILFLFFAFEMHSYAAEDVTVDVEYIESLVPENYYYLLFEQPVPASPEGNYQYCLIYSETPISRGGNYLFCANAGGTGDGYYGFQMLYMTDGVMQARYMSGDYSRKVLPVEGTDFWILISTGFNRVMYSNHDIYYTTDVDEVGYYNSSEVFFYLPTTSLSSIARRKVTMQMMLGQTLGILPCLIPSVIGYRAIWKGLSYLYSLLRMA